MTICCISDTHGKHDQLDLSKYPADVLVHAGDWTKGKDLAFTETYEFLQWMSAQPFTHKILIAGNHELLVEEANNYFREFLLGYSDITYLENSSTSINGINFFGSPYSNKFHNWAFMGTDDELDEIWSQIPDNTNVLITHGPAYGTHDLVKRAYGRDPHVGSQSLAYRKKELESTLKLHISGHIHEAYGMTTNNTHTNVCASILNEHYQAVNSPIIVEV